MATETTPRNSSLGPIIGNIDLVYQTAIRAGQTIEINYRMPWILINTGQEEYFFQDWEADSMIEEARRSQLHMFLSVEAILLWQAQGW